MNRLKQYIKQHWLLLLILLMSGAVLSVAVSAMKMTGSRNIQTMFNVGEVYEYPQTQLITHNDKWNYDETTGLTTLLQDNGRRVFVMRDNERTWRYLYTSWDGLTDSGLPLEISFYDAHKRLLGVQNCQVYNGWNMMQIVLEQPYSRMAIRVNLPAGQTFALKEIKVRQNMLTVSKMRLICNSVILMILYVAAWAAILYLIERKKTRIQPALNHPVVETLQYSYQLFGDYWGKRCHKLVHRWNVDQLRALIFFTIFLWQILANGSGFYESRGGYKYCILISGIGFVWLGLLSWEKKLVEVSWRGVMPSMILMLALWLGISDLWVSKFYKFNGYVILLPIGFFVYSWMQMKHPEKIIHNMARGLEQTLPAVILYCIILRPKRLGIVYNGIFDTHDEMAMYALALLIVFLWEVEQGIQQAKTDRDMPRICATGAGLALSRYLYWRSWSVETLIAAGVVIVVFAVRRIVDIRTLQEVLRVRIKDLGIAVIIAGVVMIGFHYGIKYVPVLLDSAQEFEEEKLETRLNEEGMSWLRAVDPEGMNGVRTERAPEYGIIWKSCLRHMNLLGHTGELYVFGERQMIYNTWLQLAYRYGLPVLIPYCILLAAIIVEAWRRKNFFVTMTLTGYLCLIWTTNIEQPFLQPIWIMVWMAVGYLWVLQIKHKNSADERKNIE